MMSTSWKVDPWKLLSEVQHHLTRATLTREEDVAARTSLRGRISHALSQHGETDSSDAWVQRFCDLVGQDGLTELSRLEAFAKLHDAVKAAKAAKP